MSVLSTGSPYPVGGLSAGEREVVVDGTRGLAFGLAELVQMLIDTWDALGAEEHVASLAVIAEALIEHSTAADARRVDDDPYGSVSGMSDSDDPTYEELAEWAQKRLVRSHTTDGRYDEAKCTCGACRYAQAAADHFRRLAAS
jgi:hypothetical protein